METALVLRVPEAEPIVADWRAKYDKSASLGVPAHVTVLFPFMPFERIDMDILSRLCSVFAAHDAVDLTFAKVGRFPDTVWLAPEPAAPIAKLTEQLVREFPDYPLYGGAFENLIPHLTVAQGPIDVLDSVEMGLSKKLITPVHSRADSCTLFVLTGEGWRAQREFSLGIQT